MRRPVTLIVDSQSGKGASAVSRGTQGSDPAKLINGRKSQMAVDAKGLRQMITVTPVDMQGRDATRELLRRLRLIHPHITQVGADSAYAGRLVTLAEGVLHITLMTRRLSRNKPSPAGRRRRSPPDELFH